MNQRMYILLTGLLLLLLPLFSAGQQAPKLSRDEKQADMYVMAQEFDKAEAEYNAILGKKSTDKETRDRVNLKLASVFYNIRRYAEAEGKFEAVMPNISAFTAPQASAFVYTLVRLNRSQRAVDVANTFAESAPFSSDIALLSLQRGLKYLNSPLDTASHMVTKAPFSKSGSTFWCTNYEDGILFINIGSSEEALIKGAQLFYFDGVETAQYTKVPQTMQVGPATFSSDNTRMVYTDNRYGNKAPRRLKDEKLVANTLRIVEVSYNDKKQTWEKPQELFKDKSQYSICHPSLSEDGQRIYFSANMAGDGYGMDLYLARKNAKGWDTPVNLGSLVNTKGEELFANVQDGYLYFSSNGHEGFGGQDVYSVKLSDDGIPLPGTLKHMPYPINTIYNDYAFMYNGTTSGYFSSDRPNGDDLDAIYLWSVAAKKQVTQKPKDVTLNPVKPTISTVAEKIPELKPRVVEIKDVAKELIAGSLKPDAVVYYGFNKASLSSDAITALNVFFGEQKDKWQKILILGYADAIGSGSSNLELSKRRAEVVKEFLVKKGYPAEAIEVLGKGQLELADEELATDAKDLKEKLAPARKAEVKVLDE